MNYPENITDIVLEREIAIEFFTFLVAMDNFTDLKSESVRSPNVKAKRCFLCQIMARLKVSKREH